jgi:hypothetical protein
MALRVFLLVVAIAATIFAVFSLFLRPVHHDLSQARAVAKHFAARAFVDQKSERAYLLVSDKMKQDFAMAEFHEAIIKLHPDGFPSSIAVDEFEPIQGERALNVFVTGSDGERKYFYRLRLYGDKNDGYRVEQFARGSGPYPPSMLRQPFP